jgi:hypothetical protein
MKIQIKLKSGINDIVFGCTPEVIRAAFGEPEEVEELESPVDGDVESIVWNYPQLGLNFFFDAANGEPVLSTVESDNLDTELFGNKVFKLDNQAITSLMQESGFNEVEEEDEIWGEHRLTFDDAQADFYFTDAQLSLISWSAFSS